MRQTDLYQTGCETQIFVHLGVVCYCSTAQRIPLQSWRGKNQNQEVTIVIMETWDDKGMGWTMKTERKDMNPRGERT